MLLIYSVILFLVVALILTIVLFIKAKGEYLKNDERQRKAIASLKMETIRNRMSPHFFFNALSALSGGNRDTATIRSEIKTLLMLLRKSVDNTDQLAIPLAEELEVVKGYIDLMSLRIPSPFEITYDIRQEINMNHIIPAMILQIPVENAIKHGLLPLEGEKKLSIKIIRYGGGLQIEVEDNGIGYQSSPNRSIGTGTGLKILYQTIYILNSQNQYKIEFSIADKISDDQENVGTSVKIRIPENYSYEMK